MKTILSALLAALVVLPSCSSTSSEPAKESVQLTFASDQVSGAPASPITFSAKVSNLGLLDAWHYQGCGDWGGLQVTYYDADGKLLQMKDPFGPQPACADVLVPLRPGKTVEATSQFTGTLYSFDPGPVDRRYPAPAGHYRAVATF